MIDVILAHPELVAMLIVAGLWAFLAAADRAKLEQQPARLRPRRRRPDQ